MEWVGAEEMNWRKEHKYLTVFADMMPKREIFAILGKVALVLEAFSAEILRHKNYLKAIEHVAIDMWPTARSGIGWSGYDGCGSRTRRT